MSTPLRSAAEAASVCESRFETEPGRQSQIDWGQMRVHLRNQAMVLHVFIDAGLQPRGYSRACANELGCMFLDLDSRTFTFLNRPKAAASASNTC